MEDLIINETQHTPHIELNIKGIFTFRGKSYSENTFDFYEPVLSWLEKYFDSPDNKKATLNFDLIYFNSSSSKVLFDIFDICEHNASKASITINWFYNNEDDSSMEDGLDFKETFEGLNINLIVKK